MKNGFQRFLLFGFMSISLVGCNRDKIEKLGKENEQFRQQLDSIIKKAAKSDDDLKAASLIIQAQKNNLEKLTNSILEYQKGKEKLEKDLEIYRTKAAEALDDIKSLRSILDEKDVQTENYVQLYINTKMNVVKLISPMADSVVGKNLSNLIDALGEVKNIFENADNKIKQTQEEEDINFQRDLALALIKNGNNDYVRAGQQYEHSVTLNDKIFNITTNRIAAITAKEMQVDIGVVLVEGMINN